MRITILPTHKMALRIAIKSAEKRKDWIVSGELNDILEKAEGTNTSVGQVWKGNPAQDSTNEGS